MEHARSTPFSSQGARAARVACSAAAFVLAAFAAEPRARAECDGFGFLAPIYGGLIAVPVGIGGAAISSGITAGANQTREFSFGTGLGYGMLGALGGAGAGALLSYGVGCPVASLFIPSFVSLAFAAGAVALAWNASPEVSRASSALSYQPMADRANGRVAVEIVTIRF
jgi:hypothetical protein